MSGGFTHLRRFFRVAVVLARYRILMPAPLEPYVPGGVQRSLKLLQRLIPHSRKVDLSASLGTRLATAFTELGPSYIKLGQLLATRPDIIGGQIARDLQHLQDKLPPFTVQEAWSILEAEFGEAAEELFVHLGFPVAAASIAQVHQAVIYQNRSNAEPVLPVSDLEQDSEAENQPSDKRKSGSGADQDILGGRKSVAVKVLRPGIEIKFMRDFASFAWLAEKIEGFSEAARRLEPVKFVQTLRESTEFELDLRLEAAAASEYADRDGARGLVRVPEIEWQHTARRVLTTEWIDGIPLWDLDRLDDAGIDRKDLAARVIEAFLTQALFDGFFHADMHQGNLSVDDQQNLVVLDFGIMGRLDSKTRRYLARIIYGFLTRNYDLLAQVHFDAGYVPAHKSRANFAQALRAIGEPVFGLDARSISMARLLDQLFEVTRLFDMHLQPQLVLLQKTMVATEGVARNLDPDFNMWETARPVVERWMQQNLGPEGLIDEARETMETMGQAVRNLPDLVVKLSHLKDAVSEESLRQLLAERKEQPAAKSLWPMVALAAGVAALAFAYLAGLWADYY